METNRVKDFFKTDGFLRFLSVCIALILWAYVSFVLDPQTQKEITNIPVKFINEQSLQNAGLTIVNSEFTVSCEVSGRRNVIASLNKDRLWAEADLVGYTKIGRNKVSLKIAGLPASIEVVKEPEDIYVELDKTYSVQKNITVLTKGEPKNGYAVDTPSAKPGTIRIDGSQKLINMIGNVTVNVDVSKVEKSFVTKERISIIDTNGNEIKDLRSDVDTVEVSVPIIKAKKVSLKANIMGEPGKDYGVVSINVSPDKINITGDEDVYGKIEQLDLEGIDITGAEKDISKNVKIILPQDVKLVNNSSTVNVDISIKKREVKTLTISAKNIQIKDKSEGLNYQIDNNASVTVVGFEEDINLLNENVITGALSVKSLLAGEYNLPLTVNLPEGILLKDNVSVSIKIT